MTSGERPDLPCPGVLVTKTGTMTCMHPVGHLRNLEHGSLQTAMILFQAHDPVPGMVLGARDTALCLCSRQPARIETFPQTKT